MRQREYLYLYQIYLILEVMSSSGIGGYETLTGSDLDVKQISVAAESRRGRQ